MPRAARLPSRALLAVTGAEARPFLQGLITNDMEKATPESALYAALLTPQGKVLFDFFVTEIEDGFLLDTDASAINDLKKRLTLYKLRSKVDLTVRADLAVAAVFGEDAGTAPGLADPRLAALGRRLVSTPEALDTALASFETTDEEAYDAHRLSLGVPVFPGDIRPGDSFTLDANLDALNGVDYKKGCFVGQEVASRTKRKGSIRKRTLMLSFDGARPAPGTPVRAGDSEIGTVLSGRAGKALALIRLDRWTAAVERGDAPAAEGASVEIAAPDWLNV